MQLESACAPCVRRIMHSSTVDSRPAALIMSTCATAAAASSVLLTIACTCSISSRHRHRLQKSAAWWTAGPCVACSMALCGGPVTVEVRVRELREDDSNALRALDSSDSDGDCVARLVHFMESGTLPTARDISRLGRLCRCARA